MVVDIGDIYNEFSDGIFNPFAIRRFLRYAYNSWQQPAPTYVVLVGDAHYDYKNTTVALTVRILIFVAPITSIRSLCLRTMDGHREWGNRYGPTFR